MQKNKQDFAFNQNNEEKGLLSMYEIVSQTNQFQVKRGLEDEFEAFLNSLSSEGGFDYERNDNVFCFSAQGDIYLTTEDEDTLCGDEIYEFFMPFLTEDDPLYIMEVDYEKLLEVQCYITKITPSKVNYMNPLKDAKKLFA